MFPSIKLLAAFGLAGLLTACCCAAPEEEEFVVVEPEPISIEPTFTGKYK